MPAAQDLDRVKAIKRKYEAEIIKKYRAAGVGIGKLGSAYVLVVYLPARRTDIKEPVFVEGVQLKFEVTGRFKIQ